MVKHTMELPGVTPVVFERGVQRFLLARMACLCDFRCEESQATTRSKKSGYAAGDTSVISKKIAASDFSPLTTLLHTVGK